MGMDAYIMAAHSKKELESDSFWHNAPLNVDEDEMWTTIGEKWYARKFWDLHEHLVATCFHGEYECGEWIELTRDNVEEMLNFATHNLDYWNSFRSVERLCEIWYHWDEAKEAGLHFYYECDW